MAEAVSPSVSNAPLPKLRTAWNYDSSKSKFSSARDQDKDGKIESHFLRRFQFTALLSQCMSNKFESFRKGANAWYWR